MQIIGKRSKTFLGGDPFEQMSANYGIAYLIRLEGQGVATTDYYGGDRLDLSGAVQLSDDPVMLVEVSNSQGIAFLLALDCIRYSMMGVDGIINVQFVRLKIVLV